MKKTLANLLSEGLPGNIEVGRWGSEEFLIISPHDVDYKDFINIIDAKREIISKHIFFINNQEPLHCTISAGIATYKEGLTIRDVIKKADDKLYIAKISGRNMIDY